MKYIFLILLGFQSFLVHSQSETIDCAKVLHIVNSEVDDFICQVQAKSINNGEHQVYILYFTQVNHSISKVCFTLGHIINEDELNFIPNHYFFKRNNDYVLVIFDKNIPKDFEASMAAFFENFENNEESLTYRDIKNRLFKTRTDSQSEAPKGITYTPRGIVFCQENGKRISQYFKDANEIPIEKSIYKFWISGEVNNVE